MISLFREWWLFAWEHFGLRSLFYWAGDVVLSGPAGCRPLVLIDRNWRSAPI